MFQYLKSFFSSRAARYRHHHQLFGHTEPINTLAISNEGKWLASGGMFSHHVLCSREMKGFLLGVDGIRFWNIEKGTQIGKVHSVQSVRGQPSSSIWAFQNGVDHLVYGTAGGYIVICAYVTSQVCRAVDQMPLLMLTSWFRSNFRSFDV